MAPPEQKDDDLTFFESYVYKHAFMRQIATDMQGELELILNIPNLNDPEVLTPETFEQCYDPELQTVAVDAHNSYSFCESAGFATHHLREKPVNIVYFAGPDNGLEVTDQGVVARDGIFFLADGRTAYGRFPEPISVSMIDSTDRDVLEQCSDGGALTALSPGDYDTIMDKRNLHELVEGLGVQPPKRLTVEDLSTPNAHVVIKPSRDAQGTGILMSDGKSSPELLRRAYDFLLKSGYDPIIEEQIQMVPLRDPETGRDLDWNARVIISNGKFVDMYIRADEPGSPVNKSTGSKVVMTEDLSKYTSCESTADEILTKLRNATDSVASRLNEGFLGLDLTVDADGRVRIFEINAGYVGGLQTIAGQNGRERGVQNAGVILESYADRLSSGEPPRQAIRRNLGSVAVSRSTLAFAALKTNKSLPRYNPEDEKTDSRPRLDRHNDFLILDEARRKARYTLNPDLERTLTQKMVEEYPLELRGHLSALISQSSQPEVFRDFLNQMRETYPRDKEWLSSSGLLEAMTPNLAGVRDFVDEISAPHGDRTIGKSISLVLNRRLLSGWAEEMPAGVWSELAEITWTACDEGFDRALVELNEYIRANKGDARLIAQHYKVELCLAAGLSNESDEAFEELTTSIGQLI